MSGDPSEPLFRKIDCLQIPVPDLDAGLAFYRNILGTRLSGAALPRLACAFLTPTPRSSSRPSAQN